MTDPASNTDLPQTPTEVTDAPSPKRRGRPPIPPELRGDGKRPRKDRIGKPRSTINNDRETSTVLATEAVRITLEQKKRVHEEARLAGLSHGEIYRRIIDEYLWRKDNAAGRTREMRAVHRRLQDIEKMLGSFVDTVTSQHLNITQKVHLHMQDEPGQADPEKASTDAQGRPQGTDPAADHGAGAGPSGGTVGIPG